ncbi:MAG: GatB/YqeY domain-containing protein [Erysipelotrichaceae bacterium]|nr:GatB/YqeY domain-containing protein [Erysipelotrichaceae bacterium]
MLYDTLKKDNLMALKEHDNNKRNILGVVITNATLLLTEKRSRNEELTDNDVQLIISKAIKSVEEEAQAFKMANREEKYLDLMKQKEILSAYLPKMLSKEEIIAEINKLTDHSIPTIMKHFKSNFMGKVDMGLVNQIAKQLN